MKQNPFGIPLKKCPTDLQTLKFSFKHEIMSMDGFSPEYQKENQDFAHFHSFYLNKEIVKLFLLADGHGPNGQMASKQAIELLCRFVETKMTLNHDGEFTEDTIKELIIESFSDVQIAFKKDPENTFKYSGTTMVLVLIKKGIMYMANTGDSKGFLASKVNTQIVPTLITHEHKPDDGREKERIEKTGGVVCPFFEADNTPNGPCRVWNQARSEPGLAASRTLGDIVGHSLGVIHTPGTEVIIVRCIYKESRPTRCVLLPRIRWCVGLFDPERNH